MPKPTTLLDRLEELEREHGSYRKLAAACDLSPATISTMVRRARERGATEAGSGKTLVQIANKLGLSVQWLMTGQGPKRLGDTLGQLLETNPGAWSDAAVAAALAHQATGAKLGEVEWRRMLDRIERALAGTPEPPASEMRDSERGIKVR